MIDSLLILAAGLLISLVVIRWALHRAAPGKVWKIKMVGEPMFYHSGQLGQIDWSRVESCEEVSE